MASIGELFLALGFDVDDNKLKAFREKLKDTHEEMVKLGTVAGGTLASLSLFVQKSADGAVRLNNMATLWGVNAQAAQTFANALHQVNSQISLSAGQEKYRAFAEMINAKVPVGSGAYGALALLGVTNPWGSADEVFKEIRHNLPGRMASMGGTPDKQRARASDLLSQIGLGDSLNALLLPEGQYQGAGQYNTSQAALEHLSSYAKAAAELDEAFNKFSNDMAAEIAPRMETAIHFLVSALNWLDAFNAAHPGAATAEGVVGATAGTIGAMRLVQGLFGGGGLAGAAGGLAGALGLGAAAAGIGAGAWWALGKEESAINAIFGAKGFTAAQRAGIMHALRDESGMNPAAIGDSGMAYGIAQWHPDRQAAFARWAGHSIYGSSREEQMGFVNYELTQGMERAAGDRIARAGSEQEAYLLTKKYYERPSGSQNIVINVHSNATDNREVANLVRQHFQTVINGAYAQTNLGPQQ